MVRLHLVGHRPCEVQVGHKDEVDHRDRDRAPGAIAGDRHSPFAICLEGSAQLFDEYQAGTANIVRLDKDGVQETAREVLLRGLFREFIACEASKRSSVGVIWLAQ
jgi:hypothetical protein